MTAAAATAAALPMPGIVRAQSGPIRIGLLSPLTGVVASGGREIAEGFEMFCETANKEVAGDRKSTRLNSSHANISYADFCLKQIHGASVLCTLARLVQIDLLSSFVRSSDSGRTVRPLVCLHPSLSVLVICTLCVTTPFSAIS